MSSELDREIQKIINAEAVDETPTVVSEAPPSPGGVSAPTVPYGSESFVHEYDSKLATLQQDLAETQRILLSNEQDTS